MEGIAMGHCRILQAAWLVPDLEQAAESWRQMTGIGPFVHAAHVSVDELCYRGPEAAIDFSVAIAQASGVQIELTCQHCDHPSAYRGLRGDTLQEFHHLGIYTDHYDQDLSFYAARGSNSAVSGRMGRGRFAYNDASAAVGCMVELIERDPGYDAFFGLVAARAAAWDGTGPAIVSA